MSSKAGRKKELKKAVKDLQGQVADRLLNRLSSVFDAPIEQQLRHLDGVLLELKIKPETTTLDAYNALLELRSYICSKG